jgi:ketosteroid isomerase-like protein
MAALVAVFEGEESTPREVPMRLPHPNADPVPYPAPMTTPSSTIATYFDAARRMDKAAWVGCFAPDAESHDPVGAPPHRGHEGLGRFFDGIVALVAHIELWEDVVAGGGNEFAVAWTYDRPRA